VSCCEYADFFNNAGVMPPQHECPSPSPVPDFSEDAPLTPLEHDLMRSVNFALGRAEGRIVDCRRRWL